MWRDFASMSKPASTVELVDTKPNLEVVMRHTSGDSSKPSATLSVPTASIKIEVSAGKKRPIPKTNKVVYPVSSSSQSKKRTTRPARVPYRLPTTSWEEDDRSAKPATSGCGGDDKGGALSSTLSSQSLHDHSAVMGLKLGKKETGLLEAFRHLGDGEDGGRSYNARSLDILEMEKYIRWIREEAPSLFWDGLKDGLIIIENIDEDTRKPAHWIQAVHDAVTNTAIKFMSQVSKGSDEARTKTASSPHAKNVHTITFLKKLMTGILLGSKNQKDIPQDKFDELLEKFYYHGFRSVVGQQQSDTNPTSFEKVTRHSVGVGSQKGLTPCEWCGEIPCHCKMLSAGFQNANMTLHSLGLMDELAGPRLFAVIKNEMKAKIKEIGTDKVDSSNFDVLKTWMNESSHAWYTALYMRDTGGRLLNCPPPEFGMELSSMLLQQYGIAIIKDLFAVIIEFPESKPLLDDLKTCMNTVNLRNSLVVNLKSSLERRLLNAGVNTSEVLEAYIATVRALKYVDPTGILVQLVTPPVREYLKHREETVRVILISLTEESGELSEELARNPTNPDKTCKLNLKNYKLWKPDPIDVPKDKHNLRKSDLIEAMVSIYGSKTVFIDEYRALLADRLLRMPKPGSITREIKCLELLKLRFGEADLQKCEVMLKDVSDSQRLNTRFYEDEGAVLANEAVQVSSLVVSAQFWPSFKQEGLVLPDPVQSALEKYTKAFEMIKGNRTLEWQKHIGTVRIEIEHGGSKLSFSVSPIQATIIWHFQEKEKWSLEELAQVTGTTTTYLTNRMGFWVSKGMIVNLGSGNFMLADSINETSKATGVIPNKYVEEADTDSPMASTSSQRATELQVFWSYIEAMLTNLESLPLARIHSMLKLFATVECSSEDLQKFLDDKVSHNLLVYSTGQYQLPK